MNIFDHTDYRTFLREFCEEKRRTTSFFSYRYLAQKAGIRSTGFISSVLSGKRNLSLRHVHEIARVLGFSKRETEYFELLVQFNQARTHDEKRRYFERMRPFRTSTVSVVSTDQYEFYETWHHAAIRELVCTSSLGDDYRRIAMLLDPPITPAEARRSVQLLKRLGLIRKDTSGCYRQTDTVVRASDALRPVIIHNYQQATIDVARSALERVPKDRRDFSTLTVSVDADGVEFIRERIARLRAEVLERARNAENPEGVFQVNVQLFPLSKPREGRQ